MWRPERERCRDDSLPLFGARARNVREGRVARSSVARPATSRLGRRVGAVLAWRTRRARAGDGRCGGTIRATGGSEDIPHSEVRQPTEGFGEGRWPSSHYRSKGFREGRWPSSVVFGYELRTPESPRHARLPGLAVLLGRFAPCGACIVRVRRACLALSVRQDPAGQQAETDPQDGPHLNTSALSLGRYDKQRQRNEHAGDGAPEADADGRRNRQEPPGEGPAGDRGRHRRE